MTKLTIDRVAAAGFGLQAEDIDQVLYDAYGQRQINEYQERDQSIQVILEADPRQRSRADSLQHFYLRSPSTGADGAAGRGDDGRAAVGRGR